MREKRRNGQTTWSAATTAQRSDGRREARGSHTVSRQAIAMELSEGNGRKRGGESRLCEYPLTQLTPRVIIVRWRTTEVRRTGVNTAGGRE